MAVALEEDFSSWLSAKLRDLNTDEGVFGSYIQSILEGDESPDEKTEALQAILSEIIGDDGNICAMCTEVMEKWVFYQPQKTPQPPAEGEDVDTKLVRLLESQSLATTKTRKYTEEEKKIREAILSQYSQMTDDEAEDEEPVENKENGIEKNTNAQTVLQAEKNKREQARIDSQKKKERDKEDREKQKQVREEKKEKRKTQKGERRR